MGNPTFWILLVFIGCGVVVLLGIMPILIMFGAIVFGVLFH